jgi:hypothetical protein
LHSAKIAPYNNNLNNNKRKKDVVVNFKKLKEKKK